MLRKTMGRWQERRKSAPPSTDAVKRLEIEFSDPQQVPRLNLQDSPRMVCTSACLFQTTSYVRRFFFLSLLACL